MIQMLLEGGALVLNPECITLILLGVIIGIIFGAIPGLSVTMAVALFLPITFKLLPIQGISLLIGLYIGGVSGGLMPAILINIPGTTSSIATCFDGHPMAEKGQANKALGAGILYSFLGGILSIFALIFISPILADFAIQFGAPDFFAIALFSLTLIATISTGSIVKGLFSGLLGILLATVGTSPIDGNMRFTFGFHEIDAGFDLLPVLIGLFAVSEILLTAEKSVRLSENNVVIRKLDKIKGFGVSIKEFGEQFVNF